MSIYKSGITFLITNDLKSTTDFYLSKLNLKLALDQGDCRIFQICQNSFIGFIQKENKASNEGIILTFETDDVDQLYDDFIKMDIVVETRPRFNEKYNIYQMFIRDPSGYLLEFQKFFDPAWEDVKKGYYKFGYK